MWIKRVLIIAPVALIVVLLQSVLWVPGTAAVSDNEGRLNQLMLYMGANPEDMNVWTSTKTSDTTISDYLFEGLIKINHNYEFEAGLAQSVLVKHEITSRVPEGISPEAFEKELRVLFGAKLKNFEKLSDGDKPLRLNLDTGKVLADADRTPEPDVVIEIPRLGQVKFTLAPELKNDSVESAIEPDYEEVFAKHFGKAPWEPLDVAAMTKRALAKVPADKNDKLTEKVVSKLIGDEIAKLDPTISTHSPVLEFHVRKGVHWVDGPYFTPREKVWQCTCNGEPCGVVTADSEAEAIQTMKSRELVENPNSATYTAVNYKDTFGDEKEGFWWGKGPELKARDAKITFDHVRNPDFKSPRISSYTDITEIRVFADDPYKLEIVYGQLYSPALYDLNGGILPYHVWNLTAWKEEAIRRGKGPRDVGQSHSAYNPMKQLVSREREFGRKPSTLGFMVIEPLSGDSIPLWQNGLKCRLRSNPFYWERKPEYQFIDYYVFDPNLGRETSEVVFNTGGIDIYTPKDYQVDRYVAQKDRYSVLRRMVNQYEYLGFNCSRPQLADRRVRLALSLAIDVAQIMKYVVYDQGVRINGPAYPVLAWYDKDYMIEHKWRTDGKDTDGNTVARKGKTEKIKYLPYDVAEAKAILLECGYEDVNGKLVKDGKPLRLEFINSSAPGPRHNTALLAKENWQKLGVDVDYKEYEWNVFIQQYVMAEKFDVCMLGWSGGIDHDMRQLWHSTCWPTKGGLNLACYSNPEADKLMDDILKVYDYKKQVEMAHRVFRRIADDFPYVFLYSPLATSVMDNRIVWRKKTGVDKNGAPIYENRPINHDFVRTARANLKYFMGELKRVEDAPSFSEEDFKR